MIPAIAPDVRPTTESRRTQGPHGDLPNEITPEEFRASSVNSVSSMKRLLIVKLHGCACGNVGIRFWDFHIPTRSVWVVREPRCS